MATELQTQDVGEPQLRQRLEPHLRRLQGAATLGDIVTETGLPAERTELTLRQLLDQYNGRLAVDANGELLYSFPHGLRREATWKDTRDRLLATLWQWFKIAYKVGYSVILITYFLLFLVIMIAAMVAMVAATQSSDSDFDLDLDGCGCFPLDLLWFIDPVTYRSQPAAFQRSGVTPYRAKPKADRRRVPVWVQIFEFVFGEERPAADPLARERELLAYLRDRKGRVTAADICAVTGESLEAAERTLLHLMVAHGGDVEVSDDGSLIYTFDRLMVSAGAPKEAKSRRWAWFWERREQPERLNRNSSAANWVIGLLNAFNLSWSGFFTFAGPAALNSVAGWIVLGLFPFTFSALFFLIPLIRWNMMVKENEARLHRNRLREVARKVFYWHVAGRDDDVVLPDELVQYRREAGDLVHTPGQMAALVKRLAEVWEGEPEADDRGQVGYRFERLRQEWRDVSQAREAVDPEQWKIGDIAYDSHDEQAEIEDEWRQRMTGDGDGHGT